jgi:steroid delta-isomerase-like uncharacterized protein
MSNKTLARTWFEDVFSGGKLELVETLIAPEYLNHDPNVPGGAWRGLEGAKLLVSTYRGAFPDVRFSVEAQVEEADTVVTRWKATGTHTAPLNQIPATGKPVTVTGINVKKFKDGKTIEEWANFDMMGLLRQLGVIPT